jgi:hypothetical protein
LSGRADSAPAGNEPPMSNPRRTAEQINQAPTEELRHHSLTDAADKRLIEFVRALARCAAHQYIVKSDEEHDRDGS